MPKAKWKNFSIEELQKMVNESTSFREVQQKIGYSEKSGSASITLKKVFDENGIDYTHFKGYAWNKSEELDPMLNEFGVKSVRLIKDIIIRERGNQCEECGLTEWQGKEIILQLHHIDGNHNHNVRSNLKLLCPNCHSQTDTWCNQNKNNTNRISDEEFLMALENCSSINQACIALGITANQNNYRRARLLLEKQILEEPTERSKANSH